MAKIRTEQDLSRLNIGSVVFDGDGDWMIKGADGFMHQLSAQDEASCCYLPAQLMTPETNQPTIFINIPTGRCHCCGK